MRISGGIAKGRRIGFKKAFAKKDEGDELRPTSAKVREALFDIIRNEIAGAEFLDLYAGTGGVGLEAISRGAARVVFVESNKFRVRTIHQLLSEFNFAERARVVNMDAYGFTKKEAEKGREYDIIFLDPPYGSGELMKILPLIGEGKILKEGGIVIAEHFFKKDLPDVINGLRIVKNYHYGDTTLTLYRLMEKGDSRKVATFSENKS